MNTEEAKELIIELANPLTEYDCEYTIIDNPQLKFYSHGDPEYLRFPFAVEFYLRYSECYLGKPYKEILYVNENYDGLEWLYEDYSIPVEDGAWFFISAYNKACDKIKLQDNNIKQLEKELSEKQAYINKLETRLMEKGLW